MYRNSITPVKKKRKEIKEKASNIIAFFTSAPSSFLEMFSHQLMMSFHQPVLFMSQSYLADVADIGRSQACINLNVMNDKLSVYHKQNRGIKKTCTTTFDPIMRDPLMALELCNLFPWLLRKTRYHLLVFNSLIQTYNRTQNEEVKERYAYMGAVNEQLAMFFSNSPPWLAGDSPSTEMDTVPLAKEGPNSKSWANEAVDFILGKRRGVPPECAHIERKAKAGPQAAKVERTRSLFLSEVIRGRTTKGNSMDLVQLIESEGFALTRKASTNGGEFGGECPWCGGKDRFTVWPHQHTEQGDGTYWCRQCFQSGNAITFLIKYKNYAYIEACQALKYDPGMRSNRPMRKIPQEPPVTEIIGPTQAWKDAIGAFSDARLELPTPVQDYLESRGLPPGAARCFSLGFNERDEYIQEEPGIPRMWLPRGIVIPTLWAGEVVGIKIRRDHTTENVPHRYVIASGSTNSMFITSHIDSVPLVVVESELDALALKWMFKDEVNVVATGSALKNPDTHVEEMVEDATKVIILPDNDSAGTRMYCKWHDRYGNRKPIIKAKVPIGKDVGEAIQNGFDVKDWLLNTKRILD